VGELRWKGNGQDGKGLDCFSFCLFPSPYLSLSLFRQEQSFTDGASLERLLLERLLLRKELRLRSMQERLLEQERALEQLSSRLAEVEQLPGYRSFLAVSRQLEQATAAGERGITWVRLGLTWILSTLYQVTAVKAWVTWPLQSVPGGGGGAAI
jgi:hypothetical protein